MEAEHITVKENKKSEKAYDLNEEDYNDILNGEKTKKKLGLYPAEKGKYKIVAKDHVGSVLLKSGKYIVNIDSKLKDENFFKLFEYTEDVEPLFIKGNNQVSWT